MKRLNKITELPYKQGDQPTEDDLPFREGKLFYRYARERIKKDGYFIEYWKTPEQIRILKERSNKFISENVKRHAELGDGKIELNPVTNQKWKTGEKCPKRGYFSIYQPYVKNDGYFRMVFYKTFELYEKQRIRNILSVKPKKCRDNDLPYNLDLDYVVGIFPKDYVCPVLKIKMVWGDGPNLPNSPSLDRIKPNKGYVKGNVMWISNRANKIKYDSTFKEFEMLYKWFKSIRSNQKGTV